MFQEVIEYLNHQGVSYKTSTDKTEVLINCLFCDDTKFHLYINNLQGCFQCKKCGAKGSWTNLVQNLGDNSSPQLAAVCQTSYTAQLETKSLNPSQIDQYHSQLPDRIRAYLKSETRGLTDESVEKYQIGWDGKSIILPIFDSRHQLVNIRHRRDPDRTDGAKMWSETGSKTSLFNIEQLAHVKEISGSAILITEGEFDAIVATQNGFPAVSGTGGAGTFKSEWVKEFDGISTVYICYDTDQPGKDGAHHVAELFGDRSRLVELPASSSEKVDVSDYFGKLKHTPDEFQKLLDQTKPPPTSHSSFELVQTPLHRTLHPALDYYDRQLYLSLSLPVKIDHSESLKHVVICSNKDTGLIDKEAVTIGSIRLPLRSLTGIPHEQIRWEPADVQNFLSQTDFPPVALPFIEIRQVLLKFVDFRLEIDADVLALWLIGTYCFPIFDAFPYLYFIGVKRSGKTKTLQLIEKLAFNAILSSNISPAVLFRLVEAKRCTLALDESEQLTDRGKKEELRELLNSGYKRGAPAYRVNRTSRGDMEIEAFEIYAPKAIANISGLDNVLEDRAITVTMVRTNNPDKGNLAVTEAAENWAYLRSLLYSFALSYAPVISDTYATSPEVNALLNRQNELWRPLLSLAKTIEPGLPGLFDRIRDEAIRRAAETTSSDLEDFDSAVLSTLRQLAPTDNDTVVTNKEIRDKALIFLEEDQRQYFTSRAVGAVLKRFGIPGKKTQGYWRYTIDRSSLNDLFIRYGLPVE